MDASGATHRRELSSFTAPRLNGCRLEPSLVSDSQCSISVVFNPNFFGCFVSGRCVGNYRTAKVYTFVTAGVGTKMANFCRK
jgi:hypothetical protein